jgi:hypothetical protein
LVGFPHHTQSYSLSDIPNQGIIITQVFVTTGLIPQSSLVERMIAIFFKWNSHCCEVKFLSSFL